MENALHYTGTHESLDRFEAESNDQFFVMVMQRAKFDRDATADYSAIENDTPVSPATDGDIWAGGCYGPLNGGAFSRHASAWLRDNTPERAAQEGSLWAGWSPEDAPPDN